MPEKIKKTQPETPNENQGRDNFQTPNYAIELLIPFIPKNIRSIWEPACGKHKISNVLLENGYSVFSSDLGYPEPYDNFLTTDFPDEIKDGYAIITNPPYSLKRKFYERCKFHQVPFALLIPCDYCGWIIDAIRLDNSEKIIPTRRIDFITPSGKSGATGQSSNYHSMWLTWGFGLGKSETFVELTIEQKKNI